MCTRMFSNHIVWLCHKKPMSASEIAEKLNVPTVYVEEELEILRKGENGEYGFLRRLDNGKYAINFILLDKDVIEKANALYTEQLPKICDIISNYIEEHKAEYLAFPYLNKKVDMNLILWQQVSNISWAFSENVERILKEKYFSDVADVKRPFSVFGYVDNGKYYGGGWDGVDAQNVCGFSNVHLDNIYITRIKKHFSCGLNVSKDPQIQLALRSIEGLDITALSEQEKEHAAKAIECGYLYRDGDMLYTKILVCSLSDRDNLFKISNNLQNGYFNADAEIVAAKEDTIFERLDEWIWSLENDKPPTMAGVAPKLALESLAQIMGPSTKGLPCIEFSPKYEPSLRRIALLQGKIADCNAEIRTYEKEIEAHSVRIAEVMRNHEHGVLETTTDKLLIDFVTRTSKRPDSKALKEKYPTVYDDVLSTSHSRKVKVSVQPI